MYTRKLRSYSAKRAKAQTHLSKWGVRRWRQRWTNDVDPITLDEPHKPVFRHVSERGVVTGFDGNTLAQYLQSSGKLAHPTTRAEFNSCEILRLDHLCDTHILESKTEIEEAGARANDEASNLFYLESNVADAITHMLQFAEYPMTYTPEAVMTYYVQRGQPLARERFTRLLNVSPVSAKCVLSNMTNVTNLVISGEASHPLLCMCTLDFLEHLQQVADRGG